MRQADIYIDTTLCGSLRETSEGYEFTYTADYLAIPGARPVSLTMPLSKEPYKDRVLMPFFDGLIPEGWMLDLAVDNWKINIRDRFGLLLACCRDCIGNVSVKPSQDNLNE